MIKALSPPSARSDGSAPGPMRPPGPLASGPRRRWRLLIATLFLLSACGADAADGDGGTGAGGGGGDGPRVADVRFEGDFIISDLVLNGRPVRLTTVPSMNLETVFGGLTVKPGCNTYFGSFTLADDGRASFTVAGGSNQDCGDLELQEDNVLAALRAARSWTEFGDGFRFAGDGSSITAVR